MPSNLLLLPLLAGYWFVHFCHYFKFRAQQLDGYRLLIHSSLAGVSFFAIARLITWTFWYYDSLHWVRTIWYEIAPIQFAGTAAVSLIIGLIAPFLINVFIDRPKAKALALARSTDELAKLMDSALNRDLPVAVTLDNRKFYVGYDRVFSRSDNDRAE